MTISGRFSLLQEQHTVHQPYASRAQLHIFTGYSTVHTVHIVHKIHIAANAPITGKKRKILQKKLQKMLENNVFNANFMDEYFYNN